MRASSVTASASHIQQMMVYTPAGDERASVAAADRVGAVTSLAIYTLNSVDCNDMQRTHAA